MEPRVLYEATFQFQIIWLLILILPIAFAFGYFWIKEHAQASGKKVYKIIPVVGIVFSLVTICLVVPNQIKMYQATVGAYQRGEYQTVEGYVENFHPMPAEGHDQESFMINGVRFEYSDYTVQFGYHNAKSHGGVITGNGQHLRIGYTQFDWLGNVIVYIEELP